MPCSGKMAKIKHRKKGFNFSFTKTLSIVSKICLSLWIKSLCQKLMCKSCWKADHFTNRGCDPELLRGEKMPEPGLEGLNIIHSTSLEFEPHWLFHPRFRVKRKTGRKHPPPYLSIRGKNIEGCLIEIQGEKFLRCLYTLKTQERIYLTYHTFSFFFLHIYISRCVPKTVFASPMLYKLGVSEYL